MNFYHWLLGRVLWALWRYWTSTKQYCLPLKSTYTLIFLWGFIFPAQAFACAFLNVWPLLPSSCSIWAWFYSAAEFSFPSLMRLVRRKRRKNLSPVSSRQVLPVENMFFKGMLLVATFHCCQVVLNPVFWKSIFLGTLYSVVPNWYRVF